MSRAWSDGLLASYAFFAALPASARETFQVEGRQLAQDVLAIQRGLAPVYAGKSRKGVVPGRLKDALTIAQAVQLLRIRIGYPELKGKRAKIFYAIWMEYGRKGGVVSLRRLKVGARAEWRRRIVDGRARARAKPADLLASKRTMRVTPLPPRPFVHVESRIDSVLNSFLDRFWDSALARAEAGQ